MRQSAKKGGKLPPTRELAAEYHLSRNTVIQAYQQLEIEGYIRGTIGSGYYVEDIILIGRLLSAGVSVNIDDELNEAIVNTFGTQIMETEIKNCMSV